MEVSTEEEAHAVLLENIEGAQYITIQRDGKAVTLFPLNGEIISDGMVVDLMQCSESDYNTTQYYETDDLLPQVLTEEDRRLAEALVAVQLQAQQKHQQIQNQSSADDSDLQEVSQLETLAPVGYTIETIQQSNSSVLPTLQSFKRTGVQHLKQEFVNVKCEEDLDISAESSEDVPNQGSKKRSLPHKKRIPKKLKQQGKKNMSKKENIRSNKVASNVESISKTLVHPFKCELCETKFSGQLKFFEHLKLHYEPLKDEKRILIQPSNNNIAVTNVSNVKQVVENPVEEFSEPEDIMEGIRDVVEETGAHIDDDDEDEDNDDDRLPEASNSSTIWTIAEVPENIEHIDLETSSLVSEEDFFEKEQNHARDPLQKGKIKKAKHKPTPEELTCPHCDRTFGHKNSLVYHMRSHSGERPHQCEECGKSFFAASALKVHKRLHSGDKPYKCEDCGRHFRQWGDLKYHTTSLHSGSRQFQCEYCGKDFARKYSLVVHRRIHTGEKNYKCEYCNKTFRASSYLQNHRRIHTGEKPHPCDVCGKPFRVRSDMKRHMLTHTRTVRLADRLEDPKDSPTKPINEGENSQDEPKTSKTGNENVDDPKLDTSLKSIVATGENGESILSHVSVQSLEYATVVAAQNSLKNVAEATVIDGDPLEAVARSADNLTNFDMQLYSINL